jgi:hypothetical protein
MPAHNVEVSASSTTLAAMLGDASAVINPFNFVFIYQYHDKSSYYSTNSFSGSFFYRPRSTTRSSQGAQAGAAEDIIAERAAEKYN